MKRKLKYMHASHEFLAKLLKTGTKTVINGLPLDASVVNIIYRPEYNVFHIIIHSETFRELEECELMEQLDQIKIVGE